MELKYLGRNIQLQERLGSNRTFMELKLQLWGETQKTK